MREVSTYNISERKLLLTELISFKCVSQTIEWDKINRNIFSLNKTSYSFSRHSLLTRDFYSHRHEIYRVCSERYFFNRSSATIRLWIVNFKRLQAKSEFGSKSGSLSWFDAQLFSGKKMRFKSAKDICVFYGNGAIAKSNGRKWFTRFWSRKINRKSR